MQVVSLPVSIFPIIFLPSINIGVKSLNGLVSSSSVFLFYNALQSYELFSASVIS
jgi:hypothetical protein